MALWAVLLAAGSSSRLAASGIATRKQYLRWRGRPLFWHSARTLAAHPRLAGIVFVFPPSDVGEMAGVVAGLDREERLGIETRVTAGGARRQDSVLEGLKMLPRECGQVLVHDAARPFVSPQLTARLVEALDRGSPGAIPAVAVKDTIKRVAGDVVAETLRRSELRAVQTPQAFRTEVLLAAFDRALAESWEVTDDASLAELAGQAVAVVEGEETNIKITTEDDLKHLGEESVETPMIPAVGFGYDVHRYGPGRPMKLGGVPIPNGPEVVAHSDGDCLLHALTDALLGCLGRGDIGQHFPDTDPRFSGIESSILLNEVLLLCEREGLVLHHADLTIIAQVPKIGPHREQIRQNVARLLKLDFASVNVKATTEEGLGFTGEKQGLKCVAVVTASRRPRPAG